VEHRARSQIQIITIIQGEGVHPNRATMIMKRRQKKGESDGKWMSNGTVTEGHIVKDNAVRNKMKMKWNPIPIQHGITDRERDWSHTVSWWSSISPLC